MKYAFAYCTITGVDSPQLTLNVRYWFEQFKNSPRRDLDDKPRAGRRKTVDQVAVRALVEADPHVIIRLESASPSTVQPGPCSYHLFRSLQKNHLQHKNFDSEEGFLHAIDMYFASLTPGFLRRGIDALPERWQKVLASDGSYFVE